ncbi:MAG: hypothetical protein ABIH50_04795, partial [bacterium]
KQLESLNRQEFLRFAEAVRTFDIEKGQLVGNIALPQQWPERLDPDHTKTGRQAINTTLRVIIASATGRRFFGDSSPPLPTPGMHYIKELEKTFIDVQVEDLQRTQEEYQSRNPLLIIVPTGDRGNRLKAHLSGRKHQGVDLRIIELPEEESFYLDENGVLIFDDRKKELMSSPLGHGFFPAALAKHLHHYAGYNYAFVTGTRNLGASMRDEAFLQVLGRHISQKALYPNHFFTAETSQPRAYSNESVYPVIQNGVLKLFPSFVLPKSLAAKARTSRSPVYNYSSVVSLDVLPTIASSRPDCLIRREVFKEETVEYAYKLTCLLESLGIGSAPLLLSVPSNRTIAPEYITETSEAVRILREKMGS